MKNRAGYRNLAAFIVFVFPVFAESSGAEDVILKAMRAELDRSRGLKVVNLAPPYYIEYALDDGEIFSASAGFGGLISANHTRFRLPRIQLRVGSYQFDNTNYLGSGPNLGTEFGLERFPLEDLYFAMRHYLWLATDRAYKSALETLARKRAALRNVTVREELNDFSRAEATRLILDVRKIAVDEDLWKARLRSLSAMFTAYPEVLDSNLELSFAQSAHYLLNSEGTEVRMPQNLAVLRVRALGQAPDGMLVRDAEVFHTIDLTRMPAETDIRRGITAVANNVTALSKAPAGGDYIGPILFEGQAAGQLFAQLLGMNLTLTRRPVMEPGRSGAFPVSELEGRVGAAILPETFEVVDDPTQKEWHGQRLLGAYPVDLEGVPPKPLVIVQKGVLKQFLLTRQPVKGFEGSNGRARLPGALGTYAAAVSNLFIRSSEAAPVAELRKKMIEICRMRGLTYGVLIRKLDYPSSASMQEIRTLMAGMPQSGGVAWPVSLPLLVYRVYPDGREELVRGLRFRGLNARSLKNIVAAGDDPAVFGFLQNGAPFALMGAGTFVAETSIICPSVLVDDLELQRTDMELPKRSIVPPPMS